MGKAKRRPKLAVWKFASCDGCQLTLLDCEDVLLQLADRIEVAYFLEASRQVIKGPYDISLVEGSITTPHDAERIHKVRHASGFLVGIGACATAGGIQALRNFADVDDFARLVYPRPDYIEALRTSTAIADHVRVDFELRGCPISKHHLLELVGSLLAGRRPNIFDESVCIACKRNGNICVMTSAGVPCLGPVTHGGCDALCPSYERACFGCFGPKEAANTASLSAHCHEQLGMDQAELVRAYRSFNANAPVFRRQSERHGP